MKHQKYYAVFIGRVCGIYDSWAKAREQVDGYPGNQCESFTDYYSAREAIKKFLGSEDFFDSSESDSDPDPSKMW